MSILEIKKRWGDLARFYPAAPSNDFNQKETYIQIRQPGSGKTHQRHRELRDSLLLK